MNHFRKKVILLIQSKFEIFRKESEAIRYTINEIREKRRNGSKVSNKADSIAYKYAVNLCLIQIGEVTKNLFILIM